MPPTTFLPPLHGQELGQVNITTCGGRCLFELCCNPAFAVNTVIDIGTWNGLGSTWSVTAGLFQRCVSDPTLTAKVWSLECNGTRAAEAKARWAGARLPGLLTVDIVHGRVINEEDLVDPRPGTETEWHAQDVAAMATCSNVLNTLCPKECDLLVLDGGEFGAFAEWTALASRRPRYVFLDDINVAKCRAVFADLMVRDEYVLIKHDETERNGWALFHLPVS